MVWVEVVVPRPAVTGGRSNQPSGSEITLMCKGRQAARVPNRSAEKERRLKNDKHHGVSVRCTVWECHVKFLKPSIQVLSLFSKWKNVNVDLHTVWFTHRPRKTNTGHFHVKTQLSNRSWSHLKKPSVPKCCHISSCTANRAESEPLCVMNHHTAGTFNPDFANAPKTCPTFIENEPNMVTFSPNSVHSS